MEVIVKSSKLIKQGTEGSAGFDLFAENDLIIAPGETGKIETGLKFEIPVGYYGRIETRSSWALKGYFVVGGIIDSDYRGEVSVLLFNSTKSELLVKKNDKCAQIIFEKIPKIIILVAKEFSETKRGEGGFGSTN